MQEYTTLRLLISFTFPCLALGGLLALIRGSWVYGRFAELVGEQLADMPARHRARVLDDLATHLQETNEDGVSLLDQQGSPEEYAAELRNALSHEAPELGAMDQANTPCSSRCQGHACRGRVPAPTTARAERPLIGPPALHGVGATSRGLRQRCRRSASHRAGSETGRSAHSQHAERGEKAPRPGTRSASSCPA